MVLHLMALTGMLAGWLHTDFIWIWRFEVVCCYKGVTVSRTITPKSLVFSNIEIGVTSDGKTIVCYHPIVDIPYELAQVG